MKLLNVVWSLILHFGWTNKDKINKKDKNMVSRELSSWRIPLHVSKKRKISLFGWSNTSTPSNPVLVLFFLCEMHSNYIKLAWMA